MVIAYREFEGIGARIFAPEGPFTSISGNQGPNPSSDWALGTICAGDAESEYVYLQLVVTASLTLNQGDVLVWDHTYSAVPLLTPAAASGLGGVGVDVGTFFLGGRVGDPAAILGQGNNWSYTFAPGLYYIWVQRAGTSLLKAGTITTQATASVSTAVAGQISQITQVGHALTVGPVFTIPQSVTFTGTLTSGSTSITACSAANGSALYGIERGMVLTGTSGFAAGAVVADIQGSTIVMSIAATATASAQTNTATTQQFVGSGASGASFLTSSQSALSNIYPNQTLNGTGVTALTITSITGAPGSWTINLSSTLSGAATNATYTATGYYVGYLRWATVTATP
jgi:hypothetical protein